MFLIAGEDENYLITCVFATLRISWNNDYYSFVMVPLGAGEVKQEYCLKAFMAESVISMHK